MAVKKPSAPLETHPDFGKWLTYAEAVKSQTAVRKGLDNTPSDAQYANMRHVYDTIYAPACERFGKLSVSSFFRSEAVNKAVGGSRTSAHCEGLAIDIDCDGIPAVTNAGFFLWVVETLKFDQAIYEFPDANGNPAWIHVGDRITSPRRMQALTAVRTKAGVAYRQFKHISPGKKS